VRGKLAVFIALAVVLAAVFIRLGVWQLDRLGERRTQTTGLRGRMAEPPVAWEQLRDTMAYRRATVTGSPDHANEIVFTGRSRDGSPGVYILTPLRRPGNDTAVLVLRGWVYAADAATIDRATWRESRTSFHGFVQALSEREATPPLSDRRVRSLTVAGVRALLPYPVARMYLIAQDSAAPSAPARLPPPALNDGSHLGYAIQWFCFAAIALVGAGIVAFRASRSRATGASGA
jgi:surfeit locus 1 family protein